MKHAFSYMVSRFLLFVCSVFVLTIAPSSCSHDARYPTQLSLADSLMYARPDSSLAILTAYHDSIAAAPLPTRMYFDLLLTTARDKNYLSHTSDSTALRLVSYYEKHGPQALLSRAYYIAGRVYDDLQNAPTALEYYQKSIDTTPKDSDYRQLALAYEQIGGVYMEQNLHKESIIAYKKAYVYALKGNERLYLSYIFRDLGRAYTMRNNVDSTLYYYEKSFAMGDSAFKVDAVVNELASIYIQLEDYKNAHRILSFNPKSYALWAYYYDSMGEADSAKLCFERSLNIDYINTKEYACRKLAQYADKEGNKPLALEYLKKSNQYKDSISEKSQTAEVKRIEALYNYEKIEAERDKLRFEKNIQWAIVAVLATCLILFAVIGWVAYIRTRNKMHFREDQNTRANYLQKLFAHPVPVPLDQFPLCVEIIKNSSNKEYNLDESRWREFLTEVDSRFPNFTVRLRTLYPRIKENELVVCGLIKLGLTNTAIANLLCHSSAAVSNLRKRLFEKIKGQSGSSQQLNDFINSI